MLRLTKQWAGLVLRLATFDCADRGSIRSIPIGGGGGAAKGAISGTSRIVTVYLNRNYFEPSSSWSDRADPLAAHVGRGGGECEQDINHLLVA